MRKVLLYSVLVLLFFSARTGMTALLDRGGGLIYDTVLNITWLQDANFSKTSGYDEDGRMAWNQAATWAENLSYYDPARNITWTDWRLPKTLPANGSLTGYNYIFSYNGSTDWAFNISAPLSAYPGTTGSEMAYMFYNNLKNRGDHDVMGNFISENSYPPNYALSNVGPFINLQAAAYWSGSPYLANPGDVWYYGFDFGIQSYNPQGIFMNAWAVRPGDVGPSPVPLPASIWLFGSGLFGILGYIKKFNHRDIMNNRS